MKSASQKIFLTVLFATLLLAFPTCTYCQVASDHCRKPPAPEDSRPNINGHIAKGYAIVIGISEYPFYPADRQIHFGDRDAKAFAAFLKTSPGGGFDVTLLTNEHAQRSDILEAIKCVGKIATSNDVVYIFFAGHGALDDLDQAYFMPYDGKPSFPEGLGIRMDEFLADVGRNISSNTVFFIDACHAGAALQPGSGARGDDSVVPNLAQEWTKAFKFRPDNLLSMGLFAASSNEVSWEDPVARQGVFTKYLIEGIKGAADTNPADGRVTAQELFEYVELQVERESKRRFKQQSPLRSPSWAPSFPISLYPKNLKKQPNQPAQDKGEPTDAAATKAELSLARAEQRLEAVSRERPLLLQFIRAMPKGADLEIHNSGSIPPELWIDWGVEAGLCVDFKTHSFARPTASTPDNKTGCSERLDQVPASSAYANEQLYKSLVDAFSMRNWRLSGESAYDHFINSFAHFAGAGDLGKILAEMSRRGAGQHEVYQEILFSPPFSKVAQNAHSLGLSLSDNPDNNELARVRTSLLNAALRENVSDDIEAVNKAELERDTILNCKSTTPDPGCSVKQRYQFQVLRAFPKTQVYAQMLLGFELASADSRFVGIGVAQPEGSYLASRDYRDQMRMFGYLHTVYPKVRIGIASGQLSATSSDLSDSSHIRDAIEIGKADRISHGTSLQYEHDPEELLKELKRQNIQVVISLTSDDVLLDVKGEDHPFRWYLQRGVPVALSTSDEGILGTNLTQEFARAVETYGLSYGELKDLVRNSLTGSFLPGESLWSDPYQATVVKDCQGDRLGGPEPSLACSTFLNKSEKATLQWQLEAQFLQFEATF